VSYATQFVMPQVDHCRGCKVWIGSMNL